MWSVSALSALSVRYNFVRDGRYSERGLTSPVRADFTLMMEKPENGHCHSVYSVSDTLMQYVVLSVKYSTYFSTQKACSFAPL